MSRGLRPENGGLTAACVARREDRGHLLLSIRNPLSAGFAYGH